MSGRTSGSAVPCAISTGAAIGQFVTFCASRAPSGPSVGSLEKLYVSLRDLQPRIEIEEGLRLAAKKSLDRMLEMAAGTVGKGDVGRPIISGD